jgi:hypothetical protein
MPSPRFKKSPFRLFHALVQALPQNERLAIWAELYEVTAPLHVGMLESRVRMRLTALKPSAPRTEAGEGGPTGETITHVPARPSPPPAPQRDAD